MIGTRLPVPHKAFFILLPLCLNLAACSKTEPKEAEPVVPVTVVEVQKGNLEHVITVDGILYPINQALACPTMWKPGEMSRSLPWTLARFRLRQTAMAGMIICQSVLRYLLRRPCISAYMDLMEWR